MKKFTSFLTLLTTSFAFIFPQDHLPHIEYQSPQPEMIQRKSLYAYSYDEILTLLDDLESGELEKRATIDDLEYIQNFIVHLAKEGILPDQQTETLEEDIEELLSQEDDSYHFAYAIPDDYMFAPSFMGESLESLLCKKSWIQKQWKQTKKFVKEHKTEIIVGAAVVVVAATVVTVVIITGGTAAPAVPAIVGSAAIAMDSVNSPSYHKQDANPPSPSEVADQAPMLKSSINEQVHSFKERVAKEEYLAPTKSVLYEQLTWEENTRIMGSLFAHESLNQIEKQMASNPGFLQEVEKMGRQYPLPALNHAGHAEIDRKFSSDYASIFSQKDQEIDFTTLTYQMRGQKALESGYYHQAVDDFSKAIDNNPLDPLSYLQRSASYFSMGDYDRSIADFQKFSDHQPLTDTLLSISEFSLGFAKRLPKGAYESGEELFLFITDFVKHPIQTSAQIMDAISTLVQLVQTDEWGLIAEVLSPDIHRLVTEWDTLSPRKRGKLAGYALGKHGAEFLDPGAIAKVASKSVKSAQELATICKNLKIAQETLILETCAAMGSGSKVAEVMAHGEKTAFFAEELGFSAKEMGQLKQAGSLEITVQGSLEHLSLSMQESLKLFENAGEKLKLYQGQYLPEAQIRDLICTTGIPTFPRPKGIPENYRIKLSDKPGG